MFRETQSEFPSEDRASMATAAPVNRQEEHEQIGRAAGPCVMVLFGASGDLTKRKLVPALYNLAKAKLLPKDFAVVGVSFDDLTLEELSRSGYKLFANRGSRHRSLGLVHAAALLPTRRIRRSLPPTQLWPHGSRRWIAITALAQIIFSIWQRRPSFSPKLCSSWAKPDFQTRKTGIGAELSSKNHSDRTSTPPRFSIATSRPYWRKTRFSHRPLPGQRDGAEHHGIPFR